MENSNLINIFDQYLNSIGRSDNLATIMKNKIFDILRLIGFTPIRFDEIKKELHNNKFILVVTGVKVQEQHGEKWHQILDKAWAKTKIYGHNPTDCYKENQEVIFFTDKSYFDICKIIGEIQIKFILKTNDIISLTI